MNPLSAIELARNGPLPLDQQRKNLKRLKENKVYWSYRPAQRRFLDIFNCGTPLAGPGVPTDWKTIRSELVRNCRPGPELQNNLAVARSLHRFATDKKVKGSARHFGEIFVSNEAGHLAFWLDMVLVIDNQPTVVFVDPRAHNGSPAYSHQLCSDGNRFVYSMMHEHIRKRGLPEFTGIRLAVIQRNVSGYPVVHDDQGVTLYSRSELETMVDQTYAIWRSLHLQRIAVTAGVP